MLFYVCLRDLNKPRSPFIPILQVVKQDYWENVEDYVVDNPEREALEEFTKKICEMESIPVNTDIFITWFGVEGERSFEFPQEFLQLVSEKGLRVILSLEF
ncbi:MAG: hypothetical protein HZA35_01715 [Parcubacteria group bacterium]|nr:hypothetical protein [Parcubacteria group bacterium]